MEPGISRNIVIYFSWFRSSVNHRLNWHSIFSFLSAPLPPPVISLDKSTGVYARDETVIVVCRSNSGQKDRVQFYRENKLLKRRQIFIKGNIGMFTINRSNQGGQYQCKYRTIVQMRRLWSHLSEPMTVIVARKSAYVCKMGQ